MRAGREVMHGVSLGIGSVDALSEAYLRELSSLAANIQPEWISDHLCWGGHGGHYAHDLLPLPYTEEALAHVVARVQQAQERLGRQILLENVSSYVQFSHSQMSEWEFLAAVCTRADCGILLDVNNIIVSARNHGFDPEQYLAGIPPERVGQIHLAGHEDRGHYLFDSHDAEVPRGVWALYRQAIERFGPVSTLIERDEHIPPLSEVLAESRNARAIEAGVVRR